MAGQEVKQLEECSVSNALDTWVFSVASNPSGDKVEIFGTPCVHNWYNARYHYVNQCCETEHAERQMKLLEAQNSAADDSAFSETGSESLS